MWLATFMLKEKKNSLFEIWEQVDNKRVRLIQLVAIGGFHSLLCILGVGVLQEYVTTTLLWVSITIYYKQLVKSF